MKKFHMVRCSAVHWKESELREPLADYDGRLFNWWQELIAAMLAPLFVIVGMVIIDYVSSRVSGSSKK